MKMNSGDKSLNSKKKCNNKMRIGKCLFFIEEKDTTCTLLIVCGFCYRLPKDMK